MKNRTIASLFFVGFLFLIYLTYTTKTTADILSFKKYPPMDAFSYDENGQQEIIITALAREIDTTAPVRILRKKEDGKYHLALLSDNLRTQHARQITFFHPPKSDDSFIFIADHGPDFPPFPGGKSWWLRKPKNSNIWESFQFPTTSAFTFNITPIAWDNDQKWGVLLTNIPFPHQKNGFQLLQYDKGSWVNATHLLPQELQRGGYMTSYAIEVSSTSQKEIVLGAQDISSNQTTTPFDRVLAWKGQKWELRPNTTLPPREKDPSWGTVAWASGDIGQNCKKCLVRITHNFGYTQASAEILKPSLQPELHFKKYVIPFHQEPGTQSFIPWVYIWKNKIIFSVRDTKGAKTQRPHFMFSFDGLSVTDLSDYIPQSIQSKLGLLIPLHHQLMLLSEKGQLSPILLLKSIE